MNIMNFLRIWKYKIIVTIFIIIMVLVAWFVLNYGFIIIKSSTYDSLTLSITGDKKSYVFDNYTSGNRKLIKKGSYDIVVQKDYKNYFSTFRANNLLRTTQISGNFTNQNEATIIGRNTTKCNNIVDNILYSFNCSDGDNDSNGSQIEKNVPSTIETPSYKEATDFIFEDETLINFISLPNNKAITLISFNEDSSEASSKRYQLIEYIGSDFEKASNSRIVNFTNDAPVNILAYKDGFIVYSTSNIDAHYLSNINAKPEKLKFKPMDLQKGKVFAVQAYKEYLTYYQKFTYGYYEPDKDFKNRQQISTLYKNNSQLINVGKQYGQSFLCAESLVCTLANNNFYVNKIKNNLTLQTLHIIYDVSSLATNSTTLALQKNSGLIIYTPENNSGYVAYSTESDVVGCGINSVQNSIIFCYVIKKLNTAYSFKLDTSKQRKDNLIKQLEDIADNSHVDNINISNNIIYITDNVIPIYNRQTREYNTDNDELKVALDSINRTIDKSGLDRQKYKIIIL